MSRPGSQHSALASLTATYTDSEDEAEAEAEDAARMSSVQIFERPPSVQSIGSSDQGESQDIRSSGTSGKQSLSGLVSYQDDLIDDEAVDDLYTSDSNTGTATQSQELDEPTEEVKEKVEENKQNGETSLASPSAQNNNTDGGAEITTNGTEAATTGKKKSRIPPEPPGKCNPELQEKIAKLYERKMKSGLDMNLAIQRNKNFRNPSIYEKLIKYCDIDELGSNYPTHVFDPHEWRESSYYDELAKAQKELMERRERERKDRTKVDFVSGTVKKPPAPTQQDSEPKRKSKWDQRGVMPPLLMSLAAPAIQPPVVQPSFTTSASGTKSTVINAFGSIKKPKN